MEEKQLDRAILCGKAFLASYKGPRGGTRPYKLLTRLFENAALRETGADTFDFTWKDVAEQADHRDDGKQLKRHLAAAIQLWAGHIEALSEQAVDSGGSCIPVIEQVAQGSGAGIMNRYVIRAEPVSRDLQCDKADIPDGYIRYTLEMADRPNWIGRFVNGLVAKGWVWRSMVGVIAAAVACAGLMLFLGLIALLSQGTVFGLVKSLIDVLVTLAALYFAFSPLYHCVTRRIIMAPSLMTHLGLQSVQLEYSKTGQRRADGRPIRQFRLVSYSATCLLCNARIEIENGRWRMWGRLVGRCDSNPQEHIYSFDHTTRLGRPIFPEYAALAETAYCSRRSNQKQSPTSLTNNDTDFQSSQGLAPEERTSGAPGGGYKQSAGA